LSYIPIATYVRTLLFYRNYSQSPLMFGGISALTGKTAPCSSTTAVIQSGIKHMTK